MAGISVLIGAKLSNNPLGWLGGLLLVAGYGLGFSGIATAVAIFLTFGMVLGYRAF